MLGACADTEHQLIVGGGPRCEGLDQPPRAVALVLAFGGPRVQGPHSYRAVTRLDLLDASPCPSALVARTSNRYVAPETRPFAPVNCRVNVVPLTVSVIGAPTGVTPSACMRRALTW